MSIGGGESRRSTTYSCILSELLYSFTVCIELGIIAAGAQFPQSSQLHNSLSTKQNRKLGICDTNSVKVGQIFNCLLS